MQLCGRHVMHCSVLQYVPICAVYYCCLGHCSNMQCYCLCCPCMRLCICSELSYVKRQSGGVQLSPCYSRCYSRAEHCSMHMCHACWVSQPACVEAYADSTEGCESVPNLARPPPPPNKSLVIVPIRAACADAGTPTLRLGGFDLSREHPCSA